MNFLPAAITDENVGRNNHAEDPRNDWSENRSDETSISNITGFLSLVRWEPEKHYLNAKNEHKE